MRRLVTFACLLAMVALAGAEEDGAKHGSKPGGPPGGPPKMPPAPVRVAAAVARPIQTGRTFVGTIDPSRRSVVGTEFAGLVIEFLVREGDRVETGQVLARLRTRILDLRIEAARAELDLYEKRLEELENGTRPEEIAQEKAKVEELQAGLELRRWKLEASERLYRQNTISEDELREAKLAVRAAELVLAVAQKALALAEAGPREERKAQAAAEIKKQNAEIARLEEEKERHTIKAPFDGYVVREGTEVGQWVAVGAPVAEIVHLDEVDVTVDVVEDFIGRVRIGMPVRIAVEAVAGRIFTGEVHKIVPSADRRGRTFPVKIRLKNERVGTSVLLKGGMFADATLAVGEEAPAVLVPKDAIVIGGPVPFLVWTVDPKSSTAQMAPVQLGVAVDDLVQVIGPVQPDSQVVVRGNERIMFPGQPLKVLAE